MIREATEADIPRLMDMGRRFHKASHWRDIPFSDDAMETTYRNMIASDTAAVFVNDDVTGMLGCMAAPAYFSDGVMIAQEAFWWCEAPRASIALLQRAEEWARGLGAVTLCMIRLDALSEGLDRLYRRYGYQVAEHTYAKGL